MQRMSAAPPRALQVETGSDFDKDMWEGARLFGRLSDMAPALGGGRLDHPARSARDAPRRRVACVFRRRRAGGALRPLPTERRPESPRWLLLHGRVDDAKRVIEGIEHKVGEARRRAGRGVPALPCPEKNLQVKGNVTFGWFAGVLLQQHPRSTRSGCRS